MQQNPNGLKSSIRRISPKINIPVDFFVIIAALTTNYTVQIKYALSLFQCCLCDKNYYLVKYK